MVAKHNDLGKLGENLALHFLRREGFTVLGTNVYFGKKEVDLMTQKDNVIRLVEVKTVRKGSVVSGEDNFTRDKMENLLYVLKLLEGSSDYAGKSLQIDFLSVTVDEEARRADMRLVQNVDKDAFQRVGAL